MFRLASINDLPQIKAVYRDIMQELKKNNLHLWDDIYPFDFFAEDINLKRLYLLLDNDTIMGAFALCPTNEGAAYINWHDSAAPVIYLNRLGVNPRYARQGVASLLLEKAQAIAITLGARYLRLFVTTDNFPAINLYEKTGFTRADGSYDEFVDDIVFHEYGYQIPLVPKLR